MCDNFGVIISVDYCLVDDVAMYCITPDGAKVVLKGDKKWINLVDTVGRAELSVSETEVSGQSLFSVSGKIKVVRQKFSNTPEMIRFRYKKALLKITTGNQDVYIVGDRENPLKITHQIVNPSGINTASGIEYYPSGVMKHPELKLL